MPIPSALYDRILDRLPGCGVSDDVVRRFLLMRSGDDFFARFLRRWPEMVTRRSRVYVPAAHCYHTLVRVRAAQLGCLPDEGRSTLVDDLQRVVRENADVSFIGESAFDAVLTAGEKALMLDEARRDAVSRFDRAFAKQRSLFPSHFHTWACYEDFEDQLRRHRTLFPDDQAMQDAAGRMLERIERMLNEDALANFACRRFMDEAHCDEAERLGARRSIFDDLS